MRNELVSREEEALVEQLTNGALDGTVDHLAGSRAFDADAQSPVATVAALLEHLGDIECKVIDQYFGLSGSEPLSAETIAGLTGLDAARIMDIVDGALRQLRRVETADERARKVA